MCVTPACQYVWAMIHFFKKINSVTMGESIFIPAGHPRRRRRVAGIKYSSEWSPNSPSVSHRILKGELTVIIKSVIVQSWELGQRPQLSGSFFIIYVAGPSRFNSDWCFSDTATSLKQRRGCPRLRSYSGTNR